MADILVSAVEQADGRVRTLRVKMHGVAERVIDRETALSWLAGGHSLIPVAGHGHHVTRGVAIERVEVGDEAWLRTDTRPEAADHVGMPGGH